MKKHLQWVLFLLKFHVQVYNFIESRTPLLVFLFEFCKIFQNTFFMEHLQRRLK